MRKNKKKELFMQINRIYNKKNIFLYVFSPKVSPYCHVFDIQRFSLAIGIASIASLLDNQHFSLAILVNQIVTNSLFK